MRPRRLEGWANTAARLAGYKRVTQRWYLDINLTKDSSFLLNAIHSPTCHRLEQNYY
jgi:hypothetical protein